MRENNRCPSSTIMWGASQPINKSDTVIRIGLNSRSADGRRVILDLRLAGVESERAWLDAVLALVTRNLGAPVLAVIDGNPGLAAALKEQ
jgi:transposase-like protein